MKYLSGKSTYFFRKTKIFEILLKGCVAILSAIIGASLGFTHEGLWIWGFIALTVFGIIRPDLFLIIVLAIRPILDQFVELDISPTSLITLNLQACLGIGTVIVIFSYFILHAKESSWKIAFLIPACLFLGEAIWAVIWSYDIFVGIGDWVRIASWVVMIPFAVAVISNKRKENEIIIACVFAGICCIFFSITGPIQEVYGMGERKGWFYSLHYAALLMLGIMPFVLLTIIRARGIWKVLSFVLGSLLFFAVLITFVRTAWIGLLIQIGIILMLLRTEKQIRYIILFALIVSIGIMFLYSPEFEIRVGDLVYTDTPFLYRYMGSGRIGFWVDNLIAFWDSTFIEKLFGRGFRTSILITEIGVGAHNDFIDLLSNNGVLGLGIFIWLIIKLFQIGRKASETPENKYLAIIYWGIFWMFLAISFINGIIFYMGTMWYFSAFVGLACARLRIFKKS